MSILTDGQTWTIWETGFGGEICLQETKCYEDPKSLLQTLEHKVTRYGKYPVPANLSGMFTENKKEIERIFKFQFDGNCSKQPLKTKMRLWLDMLTASGMPPSESESANHLFINHSFLVILARLVVKSITEQNETLEDILGNGYVSWILESERGKRCVEQFFDDIDDFDWIETPKDVMRRLYEDTIEKPQRKLYGEYYTPDWLAKYLVDKVLDDNWMDMSVPQALISNSDLSGIGVLDPTCGSGAFLFYAARKIVDYIESKHKVSKTRASDAAARLVHGIDIHPVAVEFSKVTLLRALKTSPRDGMSALKIFQGDALQIDWGGDGLIVDENIFQINSSKGKSIEIPKSFAMHEEFGTRVDDWANQAVAGEKLSDWILSGLPKNDQKMLLKSHDKLTQICKEEGNGIWAWYIRNTISPRLLSQKKIDRIVANPPWVRMSEIQVEKRKKNLSEWAIKESIWPEGKARTGFDIAALCIIRCGSLFLRAAGRRDPRALKESQHSAAWVVNYGSVNATNWEKFRKRFLSSECPIGVLNLSKVDEQPFTGAKSAVWLEGKSVQKNQICMHLMTSQKIKRDDKNFGKHLKVESETALMVTRPKEISGYVEPRGSAMARQGATLVPHVLVKVERGNNGDWHTCRAQKQPWKILPTRKVDVPENWIRDVIGGKNLLPFCISEALGGFIIPVGENGTMHENPCEIKWWMDANLEYKNYCGSGSGTPKTLLGRINHMNGVKHQLAAPKNAAKVIYNTSGSWVRACRHIGDQIVTSSCYWFSLKDFNESGYLTSVLNSDALSLSLQGTRKSDRDFHTHFWSEIPIPKYNHESAIHRRLSELCSECEKVASSVRDSLEGQGQIALSKKIKHELVLQGQSAQIDDLVRELLPDYVE